MKDLKDRVLKEKSQNIYMQKTQGPKIVLASPNVDQRFKSKTLLNKQNQPPNLPRKNLKPLIENSFGAAKIMMRQSVDDLSQNIAQQMNNGMSMKVLPQFSKQNQPKFGMLSKSNNFQSFQPERNAFAFSKKHHLRTEEDIEVQNAIPIIEDCQMTQSEYERSQDSAEDQKPQFSKSYQRCFGRNNNGRTIVIHESLNFGENENRQKNGMGWSEADQLRKYQFWRDEEKKMKNQVLNSIMLETTGQIMKSCDFGSLDNLVCVNHKNKKAKYRLNNFLADGEEESFYCSKCAVNIAKQGIDIEEISALDRRIIFSRRSQQNYMTQSLQTKGQTAKREQEFINFEKRLDTLKGKISAKLKLFNQKSEEMSKLDRRIQLTISNYDQLIEILKEMRKEEIEKEDQSRKQKCLDISLKKHELSAILQNIKDTLFEINNERSKMMALKNKDFSFMFDSYVNKIASYEEYLKNLEQNQLTLDIANFDQNIHEQDLDEETLIHSIFDQMYQKLTNPKLEALTSESKTRRLKTEPIKETAMESGGSSMFFCCEEESQEQPKHKAFRTLFQNMKSEELGVQQKGENLASSKLQESMNVNSSAEIPKTFRSVRYFKEENFIPQLGSYHH